MRLGSKTGVAGPGVAPLERCNVQSVFVMKEWPAVNARGAWRASGSRGMNERKGRWTKGDDDGGYSVAAVDCGARLSLTDKGEVNKGSTIDLEMVRRWRVEIALCLVLQASRRSCKLLIPARRCSIQAGKGQGDED